MLLLLKQLLEANGVSLPLYHYFGGDWVQLTQTPKIYDGSAWITLPSAVLTYDGTTWS